MLDTNTQWYDNVRQGWHGSGSYGQGWRMTERGSGAKGLGGYKLGRKQFLAGSALASAALLLEGCRREAAQQAGGGGGGSGGNFPNTPEWNFVFINHVTTNPFFVPTRYGIEDAQALLGTTSQWTGSENSVVKDMVDAMDTAISGNANGIGSGSSIERRNSFGSRTCLSSHSSRFC